MANLENNENLETIVNNENSETTQTADTVTSTQANENVETSGNGEAVAKNENAVLTFFREKFKKSGLSLVFVAAAFVFSVIGLALSIDTYNVGGYSINRLSVTLSVVATWGLLFLMLNAFLHGDKPFWTSPLYALIPFLLIYSFLLFIQPCISPIGFAFGAGDLNMGDSALNRLVANKSVVTAVFYILSAVCAVVAAFMSAERRRKGKVVVTENGETPDGGAEAVADTKVDVGDIDWSEVE